MKQQNIAIVLALAVMATACKKDKEVTPTPTPTPTPAAPATVKVAYTFVNGGAAFDPATTFSDGTGRDVRITKLKFYAHDVHLTDDEANTVGEFHDGIVLVNALEASNEFTLGTMAPEHIHQVSLQFGLDSASSYGYEDQVTAPVPLNDADMTWMWSTAAGRMFIKLEGFVDANGNNTEEAGEGFQYHAIGAAMEPVPGTYTMHHSVTAGSTVVLALKVDVQNLVATLGLNGMFHNDGAENQRLLQNLATATSPL